MALNTFKCNCLTPLHFKGLTLPNLRHQKVQQNLNKLVGDQADVANVDILP